MGDYISITLGLATEGGTVWMLCPPNTWELILSFQEFKRFCLSLSVTNDVAERSVKLVTDFVNDIDGEGDRQSLLLSVQRRRDQVKGVQTKEQLETVYTEIVEKDR